jgi:putative transposase
MACWQLYYHAVWSTKRREPAIVADLAPGLYACLRDKAVELGVTLHALGGIEDHVHAVLTIPPRIAVATCIGQLKGASSYWVNHLSGHLARLEWQEGYSVSSFGARALPAVVRYVQEQRRRHGAGRLIASLERIEGPAGAPARGPEPEPGCDLPPRVTGTGSEGLGSPSPAF